MNNISKTLGISATLVMLLAGCSQQQVSGDSSQAAGASQVAGSSQQVAGSSQQVSPDQVSENCPSCNAPKVEPVATVAKTTPPVQPRVVKPRVVTSGHTHPANRCTKSIRHNHPNGTRSHSHRYSCQGTPKAKSNKINIHALQRKLKAKGYYKGPINGVINSQTRSALQRYQQRRK